MSVTVSGLECRFQETVTSAEVAKALQTAQCDHCGATTRELMARGELLEVCAEVFATDLETGERVLTVIALCPDCHRQYHLEATGWASPSVWRLKR